MGNVTSYYHTVILVIIAPHPREIPSIRRRHQEPNDSAVGGGVGYEEYLRGRRAKGNGARFSPSPNVLPTVEHDQCYRSQPKANARTRHNI
jgi:hypothetical protein